MLSSDPLLLLAVEDALPWRSIARRAEVAHEPLEDQVDDVLGRVVELGLLEDQLAVGEEREQLGQRLLEVEVVAHLLLGQRRVRDQRDERVGLFAEEGDVGDVGERVEGRAPVAET